MTGIHLRNKEKTFCPRCGGVGTVSCESVLKERLPKSREDVVNKLIKQGNGG